MTYRPKFQTQQRRTPMKKLAAVAVAVVFPFLAVAADNASDYFENQILDYLFRSQSLAPAVSSYKVDAYTTCPTDSTAGTKASFTGYTQATVTSGLTAWKGTHGTTTGASSGTGGQISNANSISFGTNNSGGSVNINCVGVLDSTGTNLLIYAPVTSAPVAVANGSSLSIAVDGLTIAFQ